MRQVEKVIITKEDEREMREQRLAAACPQGVLVRRSAQRQPIPKLSKQAMEQQRVQMIAALAGSTEGQAQGRAAGG